MKRIEICTNDEWYRVFGPLECGVEDDTEEATKEYQRVAIDRLEMDDRAAEFEIVTAQGQRMMCHGWNGAQWENRATGAGYHIGGIGTFAALTDEEIAAIDDAHEAATDAANKIIAINTATEDEDPAAWIDSDGDCIVCGHPADGSSGHGNCNSPAHR